MLSLKMSVIDLKSPVGFSPSKPTRGLAYEYWHKMLFARFLDANALLIHPSGSPVTISECEELAGEEGFPNKWAAAASYASRMLPAIFRMDDPLMQVEYAPNL
jgi:hypothetical protein